MWNNSSYCKRFNFTFVFFLLIIVSVSKNNKMAYANSSEVEKNFNQKIEEVLSDFDFSGLDDDCYFVPNLSFNFKDFVSLILNGDYEISYNSLFNNIKDIAFKNIRDNLRFFVSIFIVVILFEIFKSFSDNKTGDSKKAFKIIFSFLFASFILLFVSDLFLEVKSLVDGLFNFANILFPILIGLLTMSGATASASVFSAFSVFLLETGFVVLKHVMLPLALSILFLSVFGSVFTAGYFSKINSLFKSIFKYLFIIFFSIFGLLSAVNVIASASRDGINLKIAKYAIKNYIPVLGGYVSDGFDYVFSCAVLIKNAIGVCSIIILVFKIIYPLIVILIFSLGFKILSALTGLIGGGEFSQMFDDVSGGLNNFLSVILASFLIVFVFVFLIIVAVGVA